MYFVLGLNRLMRRTLVKILSTTPILADEAGTKEPICAIRVIRATCLIYVDFPAIFGPVIIPKSVTFLIHICIIWDKTSGLVAFFLLLDVYRFLYLFLHYYQLLVLHSLNFLRLLQMNKVHQALQLSLLFRCILCNSPAIFSLTSRNNLYSRFINFSSEPKDCIFYFF